jgi:hypothetical protein
MKNKYFLPLISIVVLTLAVIAGSQKFGFFSSPELPQTPNLTVQSDSVITLKAVENDSTPFSLLETYTKERSVNLKTKIYSIGTLVEAIGSKENTSDLAWIYFVNGISGDVAADKKRLQVGDIVEWKYLKPEF